MTTKNGGSQNTAGWLEKIVFQPPVLYLARIINMVPQAFIRDCGMPRILSFQALN